MADVGRAVDVVWAATGAAVLASALGCDSQPSETKAGLYEPCAGAGSCAEGSCKDVGVDEFRCTVICSTQGDCPPLKDGSAALCVDPWCRSPACDQPADLSWDPHLACVDGVLRLCTELAAPPCSECGQCNAGTQVCDQATETCMDR